MPKNKVTFCESCGQQRRTRKCLPKDIPVQTPEMKKVDTISRNIPPPQEMWTTLRSFAAEWQQEEDKKAARRQAAKERRANNPKCQAHDLRMRNLGSAWKTLTPEQKKQYGNKFFNYVKLQK